MRLSIFAGVSLLAMLAACGSALSAEIPVQARPKAAPVRAPARPVAQPQPTSNWSGTQVGGFNGASQMSNAMVEPGAFLQFAPVFGGALLSPSSDSETPFSIKSKPWSYTFGGFGGYNLQFGSFVVGGEGDLGWKNGSSSNALYTTTLATYGGGGTAFRTENFNATLKQTWDSSLRVRAGYLVTPTVLVYGTGGLAIGEVKGSFGYSAMINYFPGTDFTATSGAKTWSDTRVGWTAGGGVETVIAAGWKARLEYRYADLGNYSKSVPLAFTCGGGACFPGNVISTNAVVNLHPTSQTVRVGLGYNF
jgi:outer membrane immunogenic protein